MNNHSPTADRSTPNPGAPNEALLTRAALTVYERAAQLFPVRSLALFRASGKGGMELVASAGDSKPSSVKRLSAAARATLTDSPVVADGLVCCRVMHEGALWGALACDGANGQSAEHHPLLRQITELAVENAILQDRLRGTREQEQVRIGGLSALYDIGQAMHTMAPDELLQFICEKAASATNAHACSLMLRDADNELVIRASCGLPAEVLRQARIPRRKSVAWLVATSGEAVLLNESPGEQIGDLSLPCRTDIQSSMCVPLRGHEGRILGVLSARRMVPSPSFVQEDLRLFSIFAEQAALGISNAELYSNLNRRVQEMATINRLTVAINTTLDLEYVLEQISDCIIEVVGFDRCVVYLVEHRTLALESRISRGFNDASEFPHFIDDPESVVSLAASEQIVIYAQGEQLTTAAPVSDPSAGGANTVIAAPIVVRKQTIGVIVTDNQRSGRPVEPPQVELLTTFVNHAGLAIENSRLYEAMEQKYSELNALYELSRTIGSAYGLDNAVDLLLEVASKAVRCTSAAFALVDDQQQTARIHSTWHADPQRPAPWQVVEDPEPSRLIASLRDPRMIPPSESVPDSDGWEHVFARLVGTQSSVLLIPLIADGRTVGTLMLTREGDDPLVTSEVKLLSIIGSHASVVIKNAVAYERHVQEKVLELSALYELSQRISTAGSLTEALDSILAIVIDLVDCDECLIWTVDQETDDLELRAARWEGQSEEDDRARPQADRALAAWAVRERKAVVLPDIRQESGFSSDELKDTRVRSLMSIPLMVQDEVVGVLTVHSYRPNVYSEDQVRILSVVSSQAASIYRGLEALTALTSYTDNILTSVPAGVVTLNSDGTIVSWNAAAEEILSTPERHALGSEFFELLHAFGLGEGDWKALTSAFERVADTGAAERGVKVNCRTQDDREVHLAFSISQLRDNTDEPLGLVLTFEDVTQQVHMAEEVRRMQELAAIGQLAASIAHELRNPLSSIKGAAQFLETETQDASTREFLGIIIEEVDGLNKIASEFLDFARPLKIEAAEVALGDVLRKQTSLLSGQLQNAGISVEIQDDGEAPLVRADQNQLDQVLLNLILNSIQAMPEGGDVTLSVGMSTRWPEHVQLTVRDSGPGIPQDRLSKIFVPFFTTKIKGTGLGLPVVHKIVQNHQGHIDVESTEGEGATFRIHLPVEGPRPSLLGDVPDSPPDLLERS